MTENRANRLVDGCEQAADIRKGPTRTEEAAPVVLAQPPAVVPAGPTPTAAHHRADPAPYGWQRHVVRRGDSVSGLSVTYRSTIAAIVARNHLTHYGRLIHPGQQLWVPRTKPATPGPGTPEPGTHKPAKPAKPAKAARPKGAASNPRATYRVRAGDTLSRIAVRHHMALATLLKANRLGLRTVIHPGDRILVTASRPATAPKAGPAGPLRLGVKEVPRAQVKAMIIATARRHGIDPKLALAIGWQESGWQQNVRSSANAYGIMQVIPSSGQWASSMVGRSLDLRKPQDNITAGVVILRALDRMATSRDQAIAGYYQGLASVRSRGLYDDTVQYVTSVKAIMKRM